MCTEFGAACRFGCVQYSFLPATASPTSTSSPYGAMLQLHERKSDHRTTGKKTCEITTKCPRLCAIRSFYRRDCEVDCVLGCEVLQSNKNNISAEPAASVFMVPKSTWCRPGVAIKKNNLHETEVLPGSD